MDACRCIVTFCNHHFRAFVDDDKEGWLCFDDAVIERAGTWSSILTTMVADGAYPSVMFYERC